jgi:hypothetical protein
MDRRIYHSPAYLSFSVFAVASMTGMYLLISGFLIAVALLDEKRGLLTTNRIL